MVEQQVSDHKMEYNDFETRKIETFQELNLKPQIMKGILDYGYMNPTECQKKGIISILEKKDLIMQSQSGTGKTAVFVISSIQLLDLRNKNIQCLVILPTQELVFQVYDLYTKIGKYLKIKFEMLIGGEKTPDLSDTQILISTLGRLVELINKSKINSSYLKLLVLDEADELLSGYFVEKLKEIFPYIPLETQIVLFSTTFSEFILELTKQFMTEPVAKFILKKDKILSPHHQHFMIESKPQLDDLTKLLKLNANEKTLIFVNSKIQGNHIWQQLREMKFSVGLIHSQSPSRQQTLEKFQNSKFNILITTISRGIDFKNLSSIIFYNIPRSFDQLIHTIGRSGRNGHKSSVYYFIIKDNLEDFQIFMKTYSLNYNTIKLSEL